MDNEYEDEEGLSDTPTYAAATVLCRLRESYCLMSLPNSWEDLIGAFLELDIRPLDNKNKDGLENMLAAAADIAGTKRDGAPGGFYTLAAAYAYCRRAIDMERAGEIAEAWDAAIQASRLEGTVYAAVRTKHGAPCDHWVSDLMSRRAREFAKARHAKDPKQVALQKVREDWEQWRGTGFDKSQYKNKTAFAKDMIEAYPSLTDHLTITRKMKEWERDEG